MKHTKINIPMCLAGILLCLTLISVYMTSGLYAKYTVKEAGGDSARVIRFGDIRLTESGDFQPDHPGMIVPGVKLTKKAVVDFAGSESATYVFVKIVPSAGWQSPDGRSFSFVGSGKTLMEWSVDDSWTYLKTDEDAYIYYCELSPNTPLSEIDIIADGLVTVSEQITRKDIVRMTGISIDISAAVVQSGGFDGAAAAWDSIRGKGV